MKAKVGPSAQLSAVIIRACPCGSPREIGRPCASCGSEKPPDVTDLGIIAGGYQSRWKRLKWKLQGSPAAQRRINRENKRMLAEHMKGC